MEKVEAAPDSEGEARPLASQGSRLHSVPGPAQGWGKGKPPHQPGEAEGRQGPPPSQALQMGFEVQGWGLEGLWRQLVGQGHLQRKRESQLKGGSFSQYPKNPTSLPLTQKTTREL